MQLSFEVVVHLKYTFWENWKAAHYNNLLKLKAYINTPVLAYLKKTG